jgi:LPS-assembly lipoprotein
MRQFFFFLTLLCLTSCGFHLRGNVSLAPPLHKLYIQTNDPYGQLTRYLQQYFKTSDVELVSTPEAASTILSILSETETRNLMSIDITQLTRQYNLILTVSYEITTPQGKTLVPRQTVSETRTIPIKSNQILAGSNEETTLYEQMRQAIVYDIVNQLSSNITTSLLSKTKHEAAISTNKATSHK